jgi:hypothetical protein
MSQQTWVETLVSAQVAGAAIVSSAAIATLLPTHALYTFPANYFYIGKVLRVRAKGIISATVSGPNLTLAFGFGSTPSSLVTQLPGGANPLVARATTNVSWDLEMLLTCRSIGSGTGGTMIGGGELTSEACLGSIASVSTTMQLPLTAPVVGTGFDTTLTQIANLCATWGTSSASNSITLYQYSLEAMN